MNSIKFLEDNKAKYILLIYTILIAVYCLSFGFLSPSKGFGMIPIIKLICMCILCYALFKKKSKLAIGAIVVMSAIYLLLLGRIGYTITHTWANFGPVLQWGSLFDIFVRYGIMNVEWFNETIVTVFPGLYFIIFLVGNKPIKYISSGIMIVCTCIALYCVLGMYIPQFISYIGKYGYDVINPIHNSILFSVILDYIIFPIYIIMNLVELKRASCSSV